MNLVRAVATIGGLTLVSRVLGFARDLLMARFLGAGFASDAFLVAFRLPNLFRALFAEGAFAAGFVPAFSRQLPLADGRARARAFAEDVLAVLAPALLVFTALMLAAAGPVVWAMTGGFAGGDAAKLALATEYTRLTFPYLPLISLTAMLGGVLNALGRFWVAAATPILLNLTLIAALVWFNGPADVDTARAQAVAVSVAGLLQFGWVAWAAARAGMPLRLRAPQLTAPVKALLRVIGPAALGAGATQINLLVSTLLAARFLPEGSVSWLYYADRLNQLPLGLVGVGVGTAILPTIARQLAAGDGAGARATQNRAVELALALTLPAAAALVVSAEPLIAGLLQHGAFTVADTRATAAALAAFALGLPAYVLVKVLTPGFHARGDTRTPVRVALVAVAANLAGNLALVWPLAHVGVAVATAASAWLNAALLYLALRRRGHFDADGRLRRAWPRLGLATAAMAAALAGLNLLAGPFLMGGAATRAAALAGLCAGGAVVYLGAAAALGVFRPADLKRLRRP